MSPSIFLKEAALQAAGLTSAACQSTPPKNTGAPFRKSVYSFGVRYSQSVHQIGTEKH